MQLGVIFIPDEFVFIESTPESWLKVEEVSLVIADIAAGGGCCRRRLLHEEDEVDDDEDGGGGAAAVGPISPPETGAPAEGTGHTAYAIEINITYIR